MTSDNFTDIYSQLLQIKRDIGCLQGKVDILLKLIKWIVIPLIAILGGLYGIKIL